jgi:voltage-gated potassium channel
VLVLLLLIWPLSMSLFESRWLPELLLGCVFIAAFHVAFAERKFRPSALLLGVPTLLAGLGQWLLPCSVPLSLVFHLLAALFFGLTNSALVRALYRQKTLTFDSIYAAFCGYLIVGLAFSHLYCFADELSPGAFHGGVAHLCSHLDDGNYFSFIYFSLVTLATVGGADLTPAIPATRALKAVEAIFGQFYIAVLIGGLISKLVSQALDERDAKRA